MNKQYAIILMTEKNKIIFRRSLHLSPWEKPLITVRLQPTEQQSTRSYATTTVRLQPMEQQSTSVCEDNYKTASAHGRTVDPIICETTTVRLQPTEQQSTSVCKDNYKTASAHGYNSRPDRMRDNHRAASAHGYNSQHPCMKTTTSRLQPTDTTVNITTGGWSRCGICLQAQKSTRVAR